MITSRHNPKVQYIRDLLSSGKARQRHQMFVVEGVRLVEDALAAGARPTLALYSADLPARGQAAVAQMHTAGVEALPAAPHVLEAAADTQTPQGIVAVFPLNPLPPPAHLDFVVLLDGVRDPGNVGTILRTAAAAGAQAVLLSPGSADPYAPKVVRAGMGAHFRLPVWSQTWAALVPRLAPPMQVYLADAAGEQPYTAADLRQPCALVIGGEAAGASAHAAQLHPQALRIPMPGGMESLNAAMAAGILMYEVVRQRGVQ